MSKRNRHNSDKQKSFSLSNLRKAIKLESLLGVVSVIIAGIALFFAWQANKVSQEANEITLRQYSDQLVITKLIHLGGDYSSEEQETQKGHIQQLNNIPEYLFCSHKIRLSNLGESATSLVNFSVRVSYREKIAFLEGFGEATTIVKDLSSIELLPIKDIQSILISEGVSNTTPLDQSWLNNSNNGIDLPISVSGKSSLDFVVHTIVAFNQSDMNFDKMVFAILYPYKTFTAEDITRNDSINKNMYPFKMTYIFEAADSQVITTSSLTCWDIGIYPPGTIFDFNTP